MKKNSALAGFVKRFQDILDAMDEFEMDEALEELNAQFEDTLFWMENIDEEEEDAAEEIEDALEEISDLLNDYRKLAEERSELSQKVTELDMAAQMAKNNLL